MCRRRTRNGHDRGAVELNGASPGTYRALHPTSLSEVNSKHRLISLALLLGLLVVACGAGSEELTGFVREPVPDVGDRTLPAVSSGGADFSLVAPDDGLLVVYFGYTSCPDVCPTTMSDLRSAVKDLGNDADRVEVAMATIDPGRDHDELLTNYVHAFFGDGHALRTDDPDELASVAEVFGAVYSVEETADGDIEVVHTGHTYVVDDQGKLRLTWPFGTTTEDMTSDMRILLRET